MCSKLEIISILCDLREHSLKELGLTLGNYDTVLVSISYSVFVIDNTNYMLCEDVRDGTVYISFVEV